MSEKSIDSSVLEQLLRGMENLEIGMVKKWVDCPAVEELGSRGVKVRVGPPGTWTEGDGLPGTYDDK